MSANSARWEALKGADMLETLRQSEERGLAPLIVHGISDGACTCAKADCKSAGKHPVDTKWQTGAPNFDSMARSLSGASNLNLGFRMGEQPSGEFLAVLDFDGVDTSELESLVARLGPLPATLSASTGRGEHLYFRTRRPLKNRTNVIPKLDVRGQGGYVVAPPSKHWSGAHYGWSDAREPEFLPEKWEDFLLERPALRAPLTGLDRARRYLEAMPPAISGQGGHKATFDAARKLADFGLTEFQVFELLREVYNPRCVPPWSDAELRHKAHEGVEKACRRSVDPPANENDRLVWSMPRELDESGTLPSFPLNALPDVIRDWVEGLSTETQTPPDLAALTALAALSSVIHPETRVRIRDGWKEPLVLWTVAALGSGERKSAVLSAATAPIEALEKALSREVTPQIRAHDVKLKVARRALKRAERTAETGDENMVELVRLTEEVALLEATRPVAPRFFADDATPEALADLMDRHSGKSAIFSAEGGVFGMMAGRYSEKGKAPNLDVYLKAYSGETIRVDRRNRPEPLVIDSAQLAMGLVVQPGVICDLASQRSFRHTGLLARFFYAMPAGLVGRREVRPATLKPFVRFAFNAMFPLLHQAPARTIAFDPPALERLENFTEELEPRLGPLGDLHAITDWASKLAGSLGRVAALFELTEGGSVVSVSSVDKALLLSPYLIAHAKAAFRAMGSDPSVGDARSILNWIRRERANEFSQRDAQRGASLPSAEATAKGLRILEEHEWLRLVTVSSERAMGRPSSPRFLVNPRGVPDTTDGNGRRAVETVVGFGAKSQAENDERVAGDWPEKPDLEAESAA